MTITISSNDTGASTPATAGRSTTGSARTRARRRCRRAATPPSIASTAARHDLPSRKPPSSDSPASLVVWRAARSRGRSRRGVPCSAASRNSIEQLGPAPAVYYAIVVIVAAFVMLGLVMVLSATSANEVGGTENPVRDLHPPAGVGRLRAGRHGDRDVDPVPAVALARRHRRDPRRRGDDAAVRARRRGDDQRRQLVGAVRIVRLPAVGDPEARRGCVPRRLLRPPSRPAARASLRHRAAHARGDGVLGRQLLAGRPRLGDRARRRRARGRGDRRHPARACVGRGAVRSGRRRDWRSCPILAGSAASPHSATSRATRSTWRGSRGRVC